MLLICHKTRRFTWLCIDPYFLKKSQYFNMNSVVSFCATVVDLLKCSVHWNLNKIIRLVFFMTLSDIYITTFKLCNLWICGTFICQVFIASSWLKALTFFQSWYFKEIKFEVAKIHWNQNFETNNLFLKLPCLFFTWTNSDSLQRFPKYNYYQSFMPK